jgi:hypothetical protein
MKFNIYIEKRDFDNFFIWMNRLSQGVICTPLAKYSHRKEDVEDPLQVALLQDEYSIIQNNERNIEVINKSWGTMDVVYQPSFPDSDKFMMADILRNAGRYDLEVQVVNTAIELALQIPGITPLEALIISEREWLNDENTHQS